MPPKKKLDNSADGPPAKRMRSSLSAIPSGDAWEDIKTSGLWFFDGNVVVAVIDTQAKKRYLFKVHKSVLAAHSPIWKDIFDLPQAPATLKGNESEDKFEGLPLIVFPDAASDVRDIFCLMYMLRKIPYKILKAGTVEEVAGALRLSTKYKIEPLRESIVRVLKSDWPMKLCDWDDLERNIDHVLSEHWGDDMDKVFPEPAALIRVATECNVLAVLPAAFYHLSRVYWRLGPILKKASRTVSAAARTAKVGILEAIDLRRLIVGRETLRTEVLDFLFRIKSSPDDAHVAICTFTTQANPSVWQCKDGLSEWWAKHALEYMLKPDETDMHPLNFYDPLGSLNDLDFEWGMHSTSPGSKRICLKCHGWLASEIRAERIKMWQSLPRIFGINDAWATDEDSSSENGSEASD